MGVEVQVPVAPLPESSVRIEHNSSPVRSKYSLLVLAAARGTKRKHNYI